MAQIMNTIGTTMTQFLKGLVDFWDWLNVPVTLPVIGDVPPIALFGVGFVAIFGFIFIKSLIF